MSRCLFSATPRRIATGGDSDTFFSVKSVADDVPMSNYIMTATAAAAARHFSTSRL